MIVVAERQIGTKRLVNVACANDYCDNPGGEDTNNGSALARISADRGHLVAVLGNGYRRMKQQ